MKYKKYHLLFPLSLIIGILFIGTIGYILLSDMTIMDAFYMTVITISTVGFGEVVPLDTYARLFSVLLIFSGMAIIAYAASTIAAFLIENVLNSFSGNKKMQKQINKLNKHYIICGCGRVGMAAIKIFEKINVDFVIIEPNEEVTKKMKEDNYLIIEGNATDEELLLKSGIKRARGLISLAGTDPDNLFITLTARVLNPVLHIISRASDPSTEKKLLQTGANKVILPLSTAGEQIASDMLQATGIRTPDIFSTGIQSSTPQWISVKDGSSMASSTIGELAEEMQMTIIGLRSNNQDTIFPTNTIKLNVNDKLLVIKTKETIEEDGIKLDKLKTVLIVDDNPVVLHLYSRLLAMNGLNPITASDGKNAIEMIKEHQPDAAVIDYMLPILSGIEICKKVKDQKISPGTKLILFTGDNSPETKIRALESGADDFILKTPEARTLIDAIIKSLKE